MFVLLAGCSLDCAQYACDDIDASTSTTDKMASPIFGTAVQNLRQTGAGSVQLVEVRVGSPKKAYQNSLGRRTAPAPEEGNWRPQTPMILGGEVGVND